MVNYFLKLKEDRFNILVLVTIGSVILLALTIRLIGLGSESAWIDEAYSINLVHHSVLQIIQGTAADQHPPLYYLLLKIWMLFGNSVAYARLFSALLGTINVIQVMSIGWKLGGERLGIGASLLLGLSPFHVWYSQEARQYMLLAVLTTAASIELWNCLHGQNRWWLYWIFSSLSVYTQYFAVFVLIAHGLIVLWWAYRNERRQVVFAWLLSMISTGIAFAPWIPTAINQFLYHQMPWINEPGAGDVINVILVLLLGNGVQALGMVIRLLIIIGLLVIGIWSITKIRYMDKEDHQNYGFIASWALIPFIIISILGIFYPLFQLKQYLIVLPPLILLVVVVLINIPRRWGNLLYVGLILFSSLILTYQQVVNTKDNWQGTAACIENNARFGDLVYGNPAANKLALGLYWKNSIPYNGYPEDYNILNGGWAGVPVTTDIIDHQFSSIAHDYQRVWLVEFSPQFWDEHGIISAWLIEHGTLLSDQHFGKIQLRLFALIK